MTVGDEQQMMVNEQQQETVSDVAVQKLPLKTQSWWPRPFSTAEMKTVSRCLLLLFIVSGSALALISYRATGTNDIIISKEQGASMISMDSNENKTFLMDTVNLRKKLTEESAPMHSDDNNDGNGNEERRRQLRSIPLHEKLVSAETVGYIDLDVRKSTQNSSQPVSEQVRFTVFRYDRAQFPLLGPFISFLPWIQMFVDQVTMQTILYSGQEGTYVVPPWLNGNGTNISIAELIASGNASLSSKVVQLSGINNKATVPGIPIINPLTRQFMGGIHTPASSFLVPQHPEMVANLDLIRRIDQERQQARITTQHTSTTRAHTSRPSTTAKMFKPPW